jgi:hypothetical protein
MGGGMRAKGDSWALRSGVLLGLVAATVFLLAFPVKGGGGAMGLDVAIGSIPTGELAVKQVGPFLRGAGLAPGDDPAAGTLHIRNQTGVTLSVGFNVLPSTNYSDESLHITATHEGEVILEGRLGDLRGLHEALFSLESGASADIEVTAEVAEGAVDYQGRVEDITFELHSETE